MAGVWQEMFLDAQDLSHLSVLNGNVTYVFFVLLTLQYNVFHAIRTLHYLQ